MSCFVFCFVGESKDDIPIPFGWFEQGDYYDTLYGGGTIRFKTNTFGGVVVIHCHFLSHEDSGAMGTMKINGGCDGDFNNFEYSADNPSNYICNYTCNNYTTGPTISPTPQPTLSPIIIEKKDDEDHYGMRLCLFDVAEGVTITKVEIRDSAASVYSNATWEDGELITRGCQPWKFVNTQNPIREWELAFDVRITDDNNTVLTGYDIITSWQLGDRFDFGQNFVCFMFESMFGCLLCFWFVF